MARAITPTIEQWDMLRELGLFSDTNFVLFHPEAAKKHGIVDDDERYDGYEFGGEADVWVDIVTESGSHSALDYLHGDDDE